MQTFVWHVHNVTENCTKSTEWPDRSQMDVQTVQNGTQSGSQGLSRRQLRAIPHLVAAKSVTEGCKRARVGRNTFYDWLKDEAFREELERQREAFDNEQEAVITRGLLRLSEKAMEKLEEALDHELVFAKLQAIRMVVQSVRDRKEDHIERRLDELEARLTEMPK